MYNNKSIQLLKNTVVTTLGGEAFGKDAHAEEAVEHNMYYVPQQDVWMPRAVHGLTVKSPLPAYLAQPTRRRYGTLRFARA